MEFEDPRERILQYHCKITKSTRGNWFTNVSTLYYEFCVT